MYEKKKYVKYMLIQLYSRKNFPKIKSTELKIVIILELWESSDPTFHLKNFGCFFIQYLKKMTFLLSKDLDTSRVYFLGFI